MIWALRFTIFIYLFYNISLANKITKRVDLLLHAKNPGMDRAQKWDTAPFLSSDLQHNSGQNIRTFASHTSKTYNQAWDAREDWGEIVVLRYS